MQTANVKQERVVLGRSLLDLVFSWRLQDVLNKDIYRNQVRQIPSTFYSRSEYLNSFVAPLIEETHADLLSSVISVSQSPFCKINFFKKMKSFKTPKDLFYQLVVTGKNDTMTYEPESGDLIAITNVKPRCAGDLGNSYIIAVVQGVKEEHVLKVSVLSSKPIIFEKEMDKNKKREPLFAVFLTNMTTNIRIWEALTCNPKERNMKIIEQVLHKNLVVEGENCTLCQSKKIDNPTSLDVSLSIQSSDLNESQKDAVSSCISTRDCSHRNTVKLIWGPPGTGKTKTVGFLLQSLLKLKCRTLTCAPTNVAVLEVTERLIRSVNASSMHDTYGLGDIVLFGNGERMKIDDRDDLLNVFLDYRLDILYECFHTTSGWEGSLRSMISLLEDPEKEYRSYLKDREALDSEENDDDHNPENRIWEEGDNSEKLSGKKSNMRGLKQILSKSLKENKKYNKKQQSKQQEKQSKHKEKKDGGKEQQENKKLENPQSFEEFLKKRVNSIVQRLHFCIVNLYTHLPTSHISQELVEKMFSAVDSLLSFQMLLHNASNEKGNCFTAKYNVARYSILLLLKSLTNAFPVPYTTDPYTDLRITIKQFCLANACLIFCTVSSSTKLHTKGMCPFELLVIDEAAQLKECESTIPLQLPGLRHAILIGDERQLPAMVQSKIADEADFGRSLFERLATLGHKKLLLNVQHRMHPSISFFPNREFYNNRILDGPNVKERSYNKSFLQGKMYGSYSFINVAHGEEQFDNKHSIMNLIEVAVVSEIVESLHKEVKRKKTKLRVGVISPYKAQVREITDKIGYKYGSDAQSDFSVSVRSVDGFQGGEEDVIIISTVRSNGSGKIGFLSNHQRANVALTRARHCLWIVGNGETLGNSCSVWKKLVINAKERNCFHNADEEKNLAYAITAALVELQQIHVLPNVDSLLFTNPRWKVCFTDAFWKSIAKAKSNELCKEVLSLLEKLSSGWRHPSKERQQVGPDGTSSQLVEHYKINRHLCLVWAVDILWENSHYIQILRALDILPLSDIPKLPTQLNTLYGNYTADKMNLCKNKTYEGNLVVPMRWPAELSSQEAADPVEFLSRPLASLSLRDKAGTSTTTRRNQRKSRKNRSH